jgi:hypothetical protein
MYNLQYHNLSVPDRIPSNLEGSRESQAIMRADSLYRAASFAGQISKVIAWITGRRDTLVDAAVIRPGQIVQSSYSGLKPVRIGNIIGSVSRPADFDRAFHPLKEHDNRRWIQIAVLKLLGMDLPPVELIRVRGFYFISDGHHRISVASALGQESIDARVTTWKVTGPLPEPLSRGELDVKTNIGHAEGFPIQPGS